MRTEKKSFFRKGAGRPVLKLAYLIFKTSPKSAAGAALLDAASAACALAVLYFSKEIFDAIAASASSNAANRADSLMGSIALNVALAAAAAMAAASFKIARDRLIAKVALKASDEVSRLLHEKSSRVDLSYYEDGGYFDTLHRAQAEAPYRPSRVAQNAAALAQTLLSLTAVCGLVVAFSPAVALAVLAASLPFVAMRISYARKLFDLQKRQTLSERKAAYYTWTMTRDVYAKDMRVMSLSAAFSAIYDSLRAEIAEAKLALLRSRGNAEIVANIFATAALFGSLWYMARSSVYASAVTVGSVVMYFQALQRAQSSMRDALAAASGLYEDDLFSADLFKFLALEEKIAAPANPAPVPSKAPSVAFENVGFAYPNASDYALRGVSFEIKPGSLACIVGRNGGGKSTIVKLLCRLYDPSEGRVAVDETDVKLFSIAEYRRFVSVLFQDFSRFQASAKDNVAYGAGGGRISEEEIRRAAELSGAVSFIEKLPRGWNNALGSWFEKGADLSMGQWQQIALARALVKRAPLLVLDEPTASMDALSEARFIDGLRKIAEGRTTIIVSHRMSAAKLCDQIVALDAGTAAECGTHEELMAKNGVYAELFKSQAARYEP